MKLVSDPAYERARRYGLFAGTLEEFEAAPGPVLRLLRAARTAVLRRARAVVVPSAYLAGMARGWGLDDARVTVLPNPAPAHARVDPLPQQPGTFALVGRLTDQKDVPTALAALASVPDARFLIVGDGPLRGHLEAVALRQGVADRVRFLGPRPRAEVLRILAGSTAGLLSSAWENLPHAAVEALAVGTPVVSTAVGGVPEVVRDGVNGLLVPPRSPDALSAAMRRVIMEPGLRERLAAAAAESVRHLSSDVVYGRLEQILVEAAR